LASSILSVIAAWLRRRAPAPVSAPDTGGAVLPPLPSAVYRGYRLEQKKLMVGWQVTITKNDAQVWNGQVTRDASAATVEARAYVDSLLSREPAKFVPPV
jgi:hypothetical protein